MNLDFLKAIKREQFNNVAKQLMNHYCIFKHNSIDNSDVIYRFAEIEFYLYDYNEQDMDISTYPRDCKCGEWFFHASGVDVAFETIRENNELMRFGGILIRGIEIYKQNEQMQWKHVGVIGGPKLSMYEIFNHCSELPRIIYIPNSFNKNRQINEATKRIGIKDNLLQRFVFNDVDWDKPTERIIEKKDINTQIYHVVYTNSIRKYNPKPQS